MPNTRARRKVVVVDSSELAMGIGKRIRRARLAAGLTQREVAEPRYTSAYISSLETGGAKPSMAALRYIADRLGVAVRSLIDEAPQRWATVRADLLLAAGDWQAALDEYGTVLGADAEPQERRKALLGMSEALCRLDRGRDALSVAAEARELFRRAGDGAGAARATYWLSAANSQADNGGEARSLLVELLTQLRAGLAVDPDFELRVLIALAGVAAQEDEHNQALAYLEEARGLTRELDDLRRARFLFNLATEYQQTGDYEASLVAASQSAALFRAAEARRELASLENTTALTYLQMGNPRRARESFDRARELIEEGDADRFAAHLAETEARIALAEGRLDEAEASAQRSQRLASQAGNQRTLANASLTSARIAEARGDDANEQYAAAAAAARKQGSRALLRQVLAAWADALTRQGKLEEANRLYREALT